MTSNESDQSWAARRYELMKELILIANYVHQRAYELKSEKEPIDLNTLTKRELETLTWSSEGKHVDEIANLMRISSATVKAHLDSARHKLQAITRVHAVTKAIRAGLIC